MSDNARPSVTREAFDALTCNRCGACCERFFFMSPLRVAQQMGQWAEEAAGGSQTDFFVNPRGYLSYLEWFSNLEPIEPIPPEPGKPDVWTYRCHAFARDAEGLGVCTVYDRRPWVCADFPYGKPVWGFGDQCVWEVNIIGEEELEVT